MEGVPDVKQIVAGSSMSMVLTNGGDVYTWGSGMYGQLGQGNSDSQLTPKKIEGFSDIALIGSKHGTSFALNEDGEMFVWGSNDSGVYGNGNVDSGSKSPLKVGGIEDIKYVDFGSKHGVALSKEGEVYTWGSNFNGLLGNGVGSDTVEPSKVIGLEDVTDISAGNFHTMVKDSEGVVYTWGDNRSGQLGLSSSNDSFNKPTEVVNLP